MDDPAELCLAADNYNLDDRRSFILCHKPKGHEGDHGNEHFTWPRNGEPPTLLGVPPT